MARNTTAARARLFFCSLVIITSALLITITRAGAVAAPQPSPPPEKNMGPAPSSSSPPPPKAGSAVDCSTVIYDMMDCLDYVSSGSSNNSSKPDESCCEGIKKVVQLSPSCICEAFQEAADMKIDINFTRAIALPTICNVATPSMHTCRTPSKSNVPSPSLPPSSTLLAPVPSSTSPMAPIPPAQPPTTTHNPSAAAPLPTGSSSPLLVSHVVVLAVSLAAPALLYYFS